MTKRNSGMLFALLATIIWAGNFVLARGVAHDIPPLQLNFWRWTVALACVVPFALPKLKADWPVMVRHRKYLGVMGLVGVSALNTLIYKAGQTTESLNMALLVPTSPIMIILMSRIFFGEPITPRRLGGIVVVLAGVLVLISRGSWSRLAAVQFTPGDFWALGGAACFAVYSLLVRRRPAELSVEGFSAATFALGLAFTIPAVLWEAFTLPHPTFSTPVVTAILYAGVGCSFAAYLLWTKAIAAVGPVMAGVVYYSLPLFAAVSSVLILGEGVSLAHLAGGGLVIGGILFATVDTRFLR